MSLTVDRRTTCCFTGHRPEKLSISMGQAKAELRGEVEKAAEAGYDTFLTGMARGIDLWAAEMVIEFRETHPGIKLVCILPYAEVSNAWGPRWREVFDRVLDRADGMEIVSGKYHRGVFHERNRFMVDHSSRLIAVYNGTPGGACSTVQYARKQGLFMRLIPG